MEIILTVVITLMVVALTVSAINLVTLNKRTKELEDYNNMIDRNIEDSHRDLSEKIEGWVSSTDRRFDYLKNDIEKINNNK